MIIKVEVSQKMMSGSNSYVPIYPSIRVRTGVLYQLRLELMLVLRFCALKFIISNDCIAEGVPSVELVWLPDVQFFCHWRSDSRPVDTANIKSLLVTSSWPQTHRRLLLH